MHAQGRCMQGHRNIRAMNKELERLRVPKTSVERDRGQSSFTGVVFRKTSPAYIYLDIIWEVLAKQLIWAIKVNVKFELKYKSIDQVNADDKIWRQGGVYLEIIYKIKSYNVNVSRKPFVLQIL